MDNNSINLTLPKAQFFALAVVHAELVRAYEADDAHEALLYEHIVELNAMFQEKVRKEQRNYSIRLSSPQVLAFVQIWQQCRLIADQFTDVILNEVLQDIDKRSKAPKRMLPAPITQ